MIVRFLKELLAAQRVERTAPLPAENDPHPKCNTRRLVRLRELINREYCGDLTLHRIASELYLSEQYIERIIRKQYGTSLKKLVFAKRMDTAAILLLTTDETVEVIRTEGWLPREIQLLPDVSGPLRHDARAVPAVIPRACCGT